MKQLIRIVPRPTGSNDNGTTGSNGNETDGFNGTTGSYNGSVGFPGTNVKSYRATGFEMVQIEPYVPI